MEFPDPVIEIAIEPKSKADQEKLGVALAKLAAEDPSFRVSTDQETGQTILKGMGELHLDIKVDILQAHLQGRSQYRRAAGGLSREASPSRSTVDYTHKKQTGGTGQFARVKIVVEPTAARHGLRVREQDRRRRGAEGIHPGRREGPRSRCSAPACSPASRWSTSRSTLIDGALSRRRLVGAGLRNRVARGVARGAAEGRLGAARADHEGRGGDAGRLHRLGHRRSEFAARPDPGPGHARQRQRHQRDGAARQHVRLRQQRCARCRQGRATFTMQFDHYEQVPQNVAQEVQAKYA